MNNTILKLENVSKQYQLGTFGTKTIGGDVHRWWSTKILGREDPFLKIGQLNDRTSSEKAEFVWALKNINLEVKRGEVLGIVGKNGAGKSTLLKLLSRITAPTTGTIKSAGRMASLLEVGTGFHPELTGLENIFLNGTILGMTKAEIKCKLDEIIDFSGCALYIDTPVKRYSSGMKVRLGFAVAAFLDPEILVVDEVLAVGDAEFQSKAIGKMQDVSSNEGRTVLFVSHNLEAVQSLCSRAILLENGEIILTDTVDSVIQKYLKVNFSDLSTFKEWEFGLGPGDYRANLKYIGIDNPTDLIEGADVKIKIGIISQIVDQSLDFTYRICGEKGEVLIEDSIVMCDRSELSKKQYDLRITLTKFSAAAGRYSIDCWLGLGNVELLGKRESSILTFMIFPNPNLNRMNQIGILAPFRQFEIL